MAKKNRGKGAISLLQRAASSLADALTKRARKTKGAGDTANEGNGAAKTNARTRTVRREADIPLDKLAQTYTPTQTSLKAPFRASGADRSRDQEYAAGFADDRWNDEDRLTNKSGDPRIGTHGRTYEPGEENR